MSRHSKVRDYTTLGRRCMQRGVGGGRHGSDMNHLPQGLARRRKFPKHATIAVFAPVVQWIELEFPKLSIQVRFLSGAPSPHLHASGPVNQYQITQVSESTLTPACPALSPALPFLRSFCCHETAAGCVCAPGVVHTRGSPGGIRAESAPRGNASRSLKSLPYPKLPALSVR